jgi:hypothetical protein
MAQKTTLKEFESVYPKLEEAILDHARSYKLPETELKWFKEVSTKPASNHHEAQHDAPKTRQLTMMVIVS